MQKVSGIRFQVSGFAALVLVLAFACFGCGGEQARDAPGGKGGAGKIETRAGSEDTYDPSVQAGSSAGASGDVDHYRVDCRMQTHIFKEDMSKAEAKNFTARVTYQVQANLTAAARRTWVTSWMTWMSLPTTLFAASLPLAVPEYPGRGTWSDCDGHCAVPESTLRLWCRRRV
jgi:hypothetical protein